MLHNKTISFLEWLFENNNKIYFEENRELYQEIKKYFEILWDSLIKNISDFDSQIEFLNAKDCVFRINRDARFSSNKSPYKTNLWMHIAIWWRKSIFSGYYLHVESWNSFFWWWIFMPSTANAYKIRKHIYENKEELKSIINNKDFKKYFWEIRSFHGSLKRIPAWFDKDFELMECILLKDWVVNKNLTNEELLSKDLEKEILKYSKALFPLSVFLNRALIK